MRAQGGHLGPGPSVPPDSRGYLLSPGVHTVVNDNGYPVPVLNLAQVARMRAWTPPRPGRKRRRAIAAVAVVLLVAVPVVSTVVGAVQFRREFRDHQLSGARS
ncbi:hypothetical protein [Brevibacterium sp.]|uniref:hypothetical protein n=1 Tax=Brevibacterium sp. TaxID=1701 RepID=UPI002812757D|nr:hypothetical protein [Brevibacterium sp.]